ncbi:MAG: tRNA (N(6)-L-threonylcarbamoyladenosine(37)-C(2))-methylthiotransferase MtaB [Bdellovibrionaceae bacterium]|nr:tRNA (N(6)-L-threonylcarbamoyladenosine(37)-C(2))-methylthiotransferase MtaB [Pseudobdellovibrionaceae bacterium]
MDSNLNFQYHTFGCKVNTYDTGLMQKKINPETHNLSSTAVAKDAAMTGKVYPVHILNTCAVTQEATLQAVKLIRKLKAKDPISTIVVTGCAAQVDTKHFENIPAVDLVVANSHKHELVEILNQFFKKELPHKVIKGNIFKKEDLGLGGGQEKEHTRAFLKIQDGCNSFCSYCIIPYARGTSRSLSAKSLVAKIKELHGAGVNEVVLTGVHIGDYEDPISGRRLEDLLESLLSETQIPRIRLSSLEPVEVTARMLSLFKNSRLCPHFHMSIQSANSQVLKDMKRNYSQKEVVESLEQIKKELPHSFVGMDVIVGFPTETEESFQDTLSALEKTPWERIHVFPYSERHGTKAALIAEAVPMAVRKKRAEILRELSFNRLLAAAQRQVNQEKKILVMKNQQGLSADYWTVKVPEAKEFMDSWVGQEITVKIKGLEVRKAQQDVLLVGELL